MAKKKKNRRMRNKKGFVHIDQELYLDTEKYAEHTDNGANPLIKQTAAAQFNRPETITVPNTHNLDTISSAALYELLCQGHLPSHSTMERVNFIAEIVSEKQRGWQAGKMPTVQNCWADEKNRFLLAYLLSCNTLHTRKRILLFKRWLSKGHFGDFFVTADKERKHVVESMNTPLARHTVRDSGVAQIIIVAQNLREAYLNQIFFYGFTSAPAVITQATVRNNGAFHPVTIITIYDERYLDIPHFEDEIAEELSGKTEQISTKITALEPAVYVKTFITGKENLSAIADSVDRHYKPPAQQ